MPSNKKQGFMPRKKSITFQPQQCMLCLENIVSKQNNIYNKKLCSCTFHIHDVCFTQWDRREPGSCPICRIKSISVKTSVPVAQHTSNGDDRGIACIGCLMGCMSMCNFVDIL
jgi:hypothetical protein